MRGKAGTVALIAAVSSILAAPAAPAAPVAAKPVAGAPAAAPNPRLDYTPDPKWWGTNGRVTDIIPDGGRVYIAGGFDYVGPTTGYGVAVNSRTGRRLPSTPLIDGTVLAAAPDGNGGWYVGGSFDNVGGLYRKDAAQITASGQVTGWNPKPNAPVRALAVSGKSVIVGGDFTAIGATPRPASHLAAVDTQAGNTTPGWTGGADSAVRGLVAAGTALYAVGSFSHVDGAAHAGVARLSAATGKVDASFGGQVTGSVNAAALSPSQDTLYVGGDFTGAGYGAHRSWRHGLAAFTTGIGTLRSWAPATDGPVRALAVDPAKGTVFAGGTFGRIWRHVRARIAAITPNNTLLPFYAVLNGCNAPHTTKNAHSNAPCITEVDSLTIDHGTLYVGGRFSQSHTTQRHDAAAFAVGSGRLAAWDPVASNRVLALAPSAGNVFVGGQLTSVNGAVRQGVAALDARTGAVDRTFNADANNMVVDMALSPDGKRLYLGGHFTSVRGLPRARLASVSASSGVPDPAFAPVLDDDALALEVANNSLYVAGQFLHVNKIARSHVVKLSLTTGAVDPRFHAGTTGPPGPLQAGGMVQTMQISHDGSKVYLGGPFRTVNGMSQPGIAVVNGTTGALLAHQLGGLQSCLPGKAWVTRLYLSADGRRLYGGDVCPDWVFQWNTVTMSTKTNPTGLNWRTLCNGGMQGALEINGHFYYGTHGGDKGRGGYCWGHPTGGPRVVQQRYFVFGLGGSLLPDHVSFDSPMGVWSFAAVPQGLLVGGDFTYAGSVQQTHQGLVLFHGTP